MTGTRIVTLVSDLLAQPDNSIREVVSRALLCEGLTNLHSGDASVAGMLDASTAGQDATDAADSAAGGHARACVWVAGRCGPSGTSAEVWALRRADEVVAWLAGDSAPGVHGIGLFGLVLGITRDMVTEWLTFGVLVLLLVVGITGVVVLLGLAGVLVLLFMLLLSIGVACEVVVRPIGVLVLFLVVGITSVVMVFWPLSMLMPFFVVNVTGVVVVFWLFSVLVLVLLLTVGIARKVVALWLVSILMSLLVLSITSNMVAWSVSVLELVVSISGIMTAMFRL